MGEHLTCTTTPEGWKELVTEFRLRWNAPHTPYHNYEGFVSVVLIALVDAEFRRVDVGTEGSCSDAFIFSTVS